MHKISASVLGEMDRNVRLSLAASVADSIVIKFEYLSLPRQDKQRNGWTDRQSRQRQTPDQCFTATEAAYSLIKRIAEFTTFSRRQLAVGFSIDKMSTVQRRGFRLDMVHLIVHRVMASKFHRENTNNLNYILLNTTINTVRHGDTGPVSFHVQFHQPIRY